MEALRAVLDGDVAELRRVLDAGGAELEEREEGGTPDIVGAIRAGIVLSLKQCVGAAAIESLEAAHAEEVLARLAADPAVALLGPLADRAAPAPRTRCPRWSLRRRSK